AINLVVNNPAPVCAPGTIDITAAAITAGSEPGLTFTYWANAAATNPLSNPSAVAIGGTYYIRATNGEGCSITAPVIVSISPVPTAILSGPAAICSGEQIILTVTLAGTGPFNFTYTDGTNNFNIGPVAGPSYQLTLTPL